MAKKKLDTNDSRGGTATANGASPDSDPALNRELLRSMLLQRRFEERTAEAYALGKIGGFCHLYIGQEAVSTGSLSPVSDASWICRAADAISRASAPTASPTTLLAGNSDPAWLSATAATTPAASIPPICFGERHLRTWQT
mgnify:CR=1 FL=1